MKTFLIILGIMLCPVVAVASEDENACLMVEVVDSYSRELLMGAQVDVLRPDSSFVKTYWADHNNANFRNRKVNLVIDSIPRGGAILRVSHEGYYTAYFNVPKYGHREQYVTMYPLMVNRVPFYKPKELDEVTVTASRVKMVVKGDTITYNAGAFALAQGSMLDGLIEQLPGAELKSDGRIYINGEFVQDLLVNGDNFFKGDPKIALENLPAYMIKDLQVYHRNDLREDKPLKDLPLVMDVRLKKQFQSGWIANAEAGYGTSDRYVGRLFGMLFTRDSRLAIVGNINNTNDDRKPGQTDNWNPNWQSAGRAKLLTGGLDYIWNSRLREWKIEANIMAKEKKSDIETISNSERYLEGGNIYGNSTNKINQRQFRISSDNKIQYFFPRAHLYLIPTFAFERVKGDKSENATTETALILLNTLDETERIYTKTWNVGANIGGWWELPMRPENINFAATTKWSRSHRESTILRELYFPEQSAQTQWSSPQEFMPEEKLNITAKIDYATPTYRYKNFIRANFRFAYEFEHNNINSTRDYYLRQIENDPLPSVTEAMLHIGFVPSNSYDYTLNENHHKLTVRLRNFFQHLYKRRYQPNMSVEANFNYAPGHIHYNKESQIYASRRNSAYVEPKVSFGIEDIGYLTYTYSAVLPSLLNMLDVTDAANPLYIYIGNPDLKTTRTHEVKLHTYSLFSKVPSLEVTYNKYENMIAQSADYNMTTGVTTYRPVNVDGNWDVSAILRSPYCFTRMGKWQPDFELRALYQNSVDLIGMDLSTVRNFNLGGKAKLTYKIMDGMEVAANGNAEWRKVTSPMEDFNPISAVDFDYGIVFRAVKLPWNMSFTTDLMMHSRRGYSDSRLNTNDLVWNARVAKSILQGNLTFALDGFDILGQLSNVRLTMNSQGRTEARYNTLPRYAMLHVIYRLNIQPKKK